MLKGITIILLLAFCSVECSHAQDSKGPDTVSIHSGKLILKGLMWLPVGNGRFPTVIFCHGSFGGTDTIHDPVQNISVLGPVFARKGYIFFGLFRRGVGLSSGQGVNSTDLMDNAFKEHGLEGRNKVQLQQLETDQLQDMISGLKFLRERREVDTNRIAILGHSFGGGLTLMVAEHDSHLKAIVIFAPTGYSWDRSPILRQRLIRAVKSINAPIMIIHAQNDYSTNPGYAIDSILNQLDKSHILKIYPKFGNSVIDGHALLFLSIETWEADVFKFLENNLRS